MSLRRPTVARTAFISVISPLCGVAPTPDCGIIILAVSARGVIQTLVWHQYYYSAFSARGVIQTLVWHQYYYSAVSARGVIQTLAWHPVFIISMSERTG